MDSAPHTILRLTTGIDPATLPKPPALRGLSAATASLAPLIHPPSPDHRMSGWLHFELLAAQQIQAALLPQLYMEFLLLRPGTMELAMTAAAGTDSSDSWKGMGVVLALNPWLDLELDLIIRTFARADRLFLRPTVAKEQMIEEWLLELTWAAFVALTACGNSVAATAEERQRLVEFQHAAVQLLK